MQRAIDRDDVLRAMERAGILEGAHGKVVKMILEGAKDIRIVRCRECKNFREGGEQTCVLGFDFNPGREDFCSRGEQREREAR